MKKYPVSRAKLTEEITKRGLNLTQASIELGFSGAYLSHVLLTGEIPERGALYLERCFNIHPEDYRPDLLDMVEKPEKLEKPETPEQIPSAMIQTAAETFARVLIDTYRETYRETLTQAISSALKERGL